VKQQKAVARTEDQPTKRRTEEQDGTRNNDDHNAESEEPQATPRPQERRKEK